MRRRIWRRRRGYDAGDGSARPQPDARTLSRDGGAGRRVRAIWARPTGRKSILLPKIIDGSLILAFAHAEPNARFDLGHVDTRATRDGRRLGARRREDPGAARLRGGEIHRVGTHLRHPGDARGVTLFIVEADEENLGGRDYPPVRRHSCARPATVRRKGGSRVGDRHPRPGHAVDRRSDSIAPWPRCARRRSESWTPCTRRRWSI